MAGEAQLKQLSWYSRLKKLREVSDYVLTCALLPSSRFTQCEITNIGLADGNAENHSIAQRRRRYFGETLARGRAPYRGSHTTSKRFQRQLFLTSVP